MTFAPRLSRFHPTLPKCLSWSSLLSLVWVVVITVSLWAGWGTLGAIASLTDDRYDGNIFALYAGNGSLVPPKTTLAEAFRRQRPALLVFYLDDSRDSKQHSSVISQLQAFYGRAADFIPVSVDSVLPQRSYGPEEPEYYYRGFVPQVVLFDQSGEIVLDETAQVSFEHIDDQFRALFSLVPRDSSEERVPKAVNEINTEMVPR